MTLRILLHDTAKSQSLLAQLHQKGRQFLSTCLPPDELSLIPHNGLIIVAEQGKETSYKAPLDGPIRSRLLSFDEWWNEPIFIDDQKNALTRRQLVLTTADQDGGAHVDPSLESTYYRLTKENSLGLFYQEGPSSTPIVKPERFALRQIGHEVLKTLLSDYQKQPTADQAGVYIAGSTLVKGAILPPPPKRSKPYRNDPCFCGSGQKYKNCCGWE